MARNPALADYRRKRDFRRTPEPDGASVAAVHDGALRFVVQRHQARRLHYDFRLELDGVLKSWAVPKGPSRDPEFRRLAVQVEDHPLAYGDFEGEIAAGNYGAGQVRIWDSGIWRPQGDARAGLAQGRLRFQLEGQQLRGDWVLIRTGTSRQWLLRKLDDEHARAGDDAETQSASSVRPARPATRPAHSDKRALPAFIEPQLATLVEQAPQDTGWSYEFKYDGYRMLCRLDGRRARLYSRTGGDWTARMSALAAQLASARLGEGWLDGEVVVFNREGHSDFQALQQALDGNGSDLHFVVFDLPYWNGEDLRPLTLAERQARLAALMQRASAELPCSLTDRLHVDAPADGRAALQQACLLGLEGLMAKRLDAAYHAGRSRTWLKLKCRPRQEFVVGGYTRSADTPGGLGALLVGVHADGELRYAGRVGTGFKRDEATTLLARMRPLHVQHSPFAQAPPQIHRWRRQGSEIQWLRPELVVEAGFSGWTRDQLVRQAAYLGLREDKMAADVISETAYPPPPTRSSLTMKPQQPLRLAGVRITNPERVVYPDDSLTKYEVAAYYATIAPYLLPHVRHRRLAMLRCPAGLAEPCFFQKHIDSHLPAGLKRDGEHLVIVNARGLVSLAQHGVIELHTWGSSLPRAEAPDRLTLDLDPGPDVAWATLYEAALLVRTLMQALGLVPFVKSTGGKGLHIVAPIRRTLDWGTARAFARAMAAHLAQHMPDRFTDNVSKNKRVGRIFVDYLRNGDNATAIAAYSLRARTGAPVSVPLAWEELNPDTDLRGDVYQLRNVQERLAHGHDPWQAYTASARTVTHAVLAQMDIPAPQKTSARKPSRSAATSTPKGRQRRR